MFVSVNEDVYFEHGNEAGRIEKWKANTTSSELVTKLNGSCYGLFIDINNNLYCSLQSQHSIVSFSVINNSNVSWTVAGTGSPGSAAHELCLPWGIFVDINLDLYVADSVNNRIQRFRSGQVTATTVAGNGIPHNLHLVFPTDVVLDRDAYLFIADNENHRIIRAGPIDYYCVAGCSGTRGSTPDHLQKAYSVLF